MASKENSVWKRCLLRLGRIPGVRMFRNNVGQAWTGRGFTLRPGQTYTARGGERVILEPRPVDFGLIKGSGDGIGWRSLEITPDMVGRRVAIFASLETKAGTKPSDEQVQWMKNVRAAGGIAVIANNPEAAAAKFQQEEMFK